ncbi:MAG TPA: hypothetical protein VK894_13530, partial [Jiangellales bacterium]|nr:hypothetical protein [Jiangellales bacterium]
EAWGDTLVVFWPGTTVVGPSALWRGQVLALLGRTDEARRDLLRALEVSEAFGLRPFTERARAALGALG